MAGAREADSACLVLSASFSRFPLLLQPQTGQMIPLSSTPGGSLYGTTPGGTKISYDRHSLLGYKNSPLSKSPAFVPQSIIKSGARNEKAAPCREGVRSRWWARGQRSLAEPECFSPVFLFCCCLLVSAGVTTESAQPIPEEASEDVHDEIFKSAGASNGGAAGAAKAAAVGGDDGGNEELFEME
jgi:hypothetical protein